ncbi:hypothetical protein [Microbacterium sp. LEMMJ01]|uniref:hypothetical protein n=2 Tax=Micrococcales TaxID=85006 RepID=UPI00111BF5A1|nr:hypothetical protein [Microbacterium sp. LEMMJ01]
MMPADMLEPERDNHSSIEASTDGRNIVGRHPGVVTFVEDGVYVIVLDRRGFLPEGETLEAAIEDMVLQLREYSADWLSHYGTAESAWVSFRS